MGRIDPPPVNGDAAWVTFDTDEKSIQASQPIELFTFTLAGSVIGAYTSYSRDVVYSGTTYKAKQVRRDSIQIASADGDVPALLVEVAVNDPVVQAFIGVGVPPQNLQVTVVRLQQLSGATEQQWSGYVTQCSVRARTASLTVTALTDTTISTQIPKVVVARFCNHVLYDQFCTVSRASFLYTTTIASLTGTSLTVPSIFGHPDQFFRYGEVQHVVTKERRTITSQVGTLLMLDVAFPTTVSGAGADPNLQMFVGCDHAVNTCVSKFNNVVNFGGHPHIISADWFFVNIKGAKGVVQ